MRRHFPKKKSLIPKQAKCVFQGIIYDVYHWEQELFDGSKATFEMLKRPDTVKVIAIKDNKLVVLEQEQPVIGAFYDIPGGMNDHTEDDELHAAQRETLEETGMQFKTWKLLSVVQPHFKIDQFVYIFLATDFISQVEQILDPGEKIVLRLMDFDEARKILSSKQGRSMPPLLARVSSIEELLALPQYS